MATDSDLTVVCVKWGTKFSVDYVNILHDMVRRHLTVPHRFVCLTDDPSGIACETQPLVPELPYWWGKMMLFGHSLPGRKLFFDLDTVILDNIDGFARYSGPFCVVKPFYRDWGFTSSIMSISPGFGRDTWEKFIRDPRAAMAYTNARADPPWNNGDQRWLELTVPRADYWQDHLPGQLYSYKVHCAKGLPPAAHVVCFHGKPAIHEVGDAWVKQHWRIISADQGAGASSR